MMRHENILAALGGMELEKAIECTRNALDQQCQPSQLVVFNANEQILLTLEERHAIGKEIHAMLEARLWVLENEAE
ncbi:hypothetical protein LCGC14_0317300 [marine sediment metagenome]|uniref:Uncharacterized protein n=1 Tax=marine sediment metagenome TaxID=412755 RepID=A0A0F9TQM8_9ZZZZ|nr:hypothetical protein [Halomonas sp.]HDZ46551.1 hypothetical protein [Halomonas sp.]HEB06603.1 hypothetical protein [Halomonas sp.]